MLSLNLSFDFFFITLKACRWDYKSIMNILTIMIRQTSIMATKKYQVHVDPNFKKIVISTNSGVLYEKGV